MTRALRRAPARHDEGSAIVEFVFLALLLLVPLVYVLLAVFALQRTAYAVTAATREAGRAFVSAGSVDAAEARARVAARIALADHGVALDDTDLEITCSSSLSCLEPGSRVTVSLSSDVALPLVPGFGSRHLASVPVRATHVQVVDAYRGSG